MRTTLAVTCCLLMVAGEGLAENGVPAEVPTLVELSSREINRIVCPGPMTDLIFSEEKGLTGHFSGNNAFIKFTAEEANGKRTYSEEPSEIYAICNGAVYTLIATPTETSAVTVRLAAAKAETVAENLERYRNLPLEKQALATVGAGLFLSINCTCCAWAWVCLARCWWRANTAVMAVPE